MQYRQLTCSGCEQPLGWVDDDASVDVGYCVQCVDARLTVCDACAVGVRWDADDMWTLCVRHRPHEGCKDEEDDEDDDRGMV